MLRRAMLVLVTVSVTAVLAEATYRMFCPRATELAERVAGLRRFLADGERNFAPHPYTGFVLDQPSDAPLPLGWSFRREPAPGVPRIACLGASTTQEGYPWELQQALLADGRLAECMNWGVSGWTSMETMINWFVNVQTFAPDVVIVHLGGNDVAPRKVAGFRTDYGHFRRPWKEPEPSTLSRFLCRYSDVWAGWIAQRVGSDVADFVNREGVPAADRRKDPGGDLTPDTLEPFRRNVASICEHASATGRVAMLMTMPWQPDPTSRHHERATQGLMLTGLREHNRVLRELCAEHGWLLIDAAAACAADPDRWSPTFRDLVHQNQEGRRLKAELVAEALRAIELPPVPAELRKVVGGR